MELNVSVIQTDLVWENPEANKRNFEMYFEQLSFKTDVVVLPEMFTTGFSMNPKNISETMEGETINWLKFQSKKHDFAICGSLPIQEGDGYFNRFVFVTPDRDIVSYDKRHLFTLAGEHNNYTTGKQNVMVHYKGWKIRPLICYDLRFPVWSRNTDDYDILLYVANWPNQRVLAWDTLLRARAIENMSYVIGVNRVGEDPNSNQYSGHSACYDFLGDEIATTKAYSNDSFSVSLNKEKLTRCRKQLNFLSDKDNFKLF